MSLLFNMQSRLVIIFLPRSKRLLISWLQSPSAVILEPRKIKSATVSTVSPSICHEVMGLDIMILVFWIPKTVPKNAQTTAQLHSFHMLVKWCLKFSKPHFSNMWTMSIKMFKLVLEKAEEPEIKLPTSSRSSKEQESSRKMSIFALLTMPKPFTVCITVNCGKFWKRWEYQTTWPASWETYMQVMKQQLELNMEKQTGSK